MKKLVGLCLLLTAFIAVNAEDIPQDPVNIADEVEEDRDDIDDEDEEDRDDIDDEDEEDRDDIDDEDEEDRDDIDEEDEDEEDEEDLNELIDMNVEDRRNPPVEECGIRCDAKALGPIIHTGSLRINTPRQCQKHCEKWNTDHPDRPQCQFFRWRGRDFKAKWRKRRRCYLLTKVTDVKKRRGWCWGPSGCNELIQTTELIKTTATPNVCQTYSGKPCIFPFWRLGVMYNQCIDPLEFGTLWCATAVYSDGTIHDVGDCMEGCPSMPGCPPDETLTRECMCGVSSCAKGSVCASGSTCTLPG